jgi:pyruvate/2-oxoglutarate dehydrogenase complex dihydrolipoamide dehydrogenase (E3) component
MSMSLPEPYQDVVLGNGAGGKSLAWHLARSGRRDADRAEHLGGRSPKVGPRGSLVVCGGSLAEMT